jgi:hypothetical protein
MTHFPNDLFCYFSKEDCARSRPFQRFARFSLDFYLVKEFKKCWLRRATQRRSHDIGLGKVLYLAKQGEFGHFTLCKMTYLASCPLMKL